MSNGVTIRNFAPTDAMAVNQVASNAWDEYASVFDGWDQLADFIAKTASLASEAELIVAERDGVVVGVVGYVGPFRPRDPLFPTDWGIVRMLSVLPEERGRGVGRMLTNECIERARRDGAVNIGLHTSPAMRSALNLYLRMGFVHWRDIPNRLGVPYAIYTRSVEPPA